MLWGKALEVAWKQNLHFWRDGSFKIAKTCKVTNSQPAHVPEWERLRHSGGGVAIEGVRKSPIGAPPAADGQPYDLSNRASWKLATEFNGKTICKAYNGSNCGKEGAAW